MADKVTADDIRKALSERYCEPDWYLGFEVGDGCGSEVTRHADAIAICPYPSRGYEALGFEIKVSKQDLKREIEQPAKAEALAKYCNYWFLVVPKGLTDDIQIPEPWGIIEYIDGKLRQKKKAVFSKKAIDIGFCCAFVRSTRRADTAKDIMREREREKIIRENIDMKIRNDLWNYEKLKERLENIKKRTGIDLTSKWYLDEYDIKAMALAKRLLASHDDISMICSVKHLTSDIAEVTDWITKTVGELQKFVDLMNGGREEMNEMTVAERLKLIEQNRVQKKEELSKAARPLIDFIRKYGTPYTTIVVSGMAAEILECEMVYKCEDEWD